MISKNGYYKMNYNDLEQGTQYEFGAGGNYGYNEPDPSWEVTEYSAGKSYDTGPSAYDRAQLEIAARDAAVGSDYGNIGGSGEVQNILEFTPADEKTPQEGLHYDPNFAKLGEATGEPQVLSLGKNKNLILIGAALLFFT